MWPFRRKAKPTTPPPMGETWRAGDIAEQIVPLLNVETGRVTQPGRRGIVLQVLMARHDDTGDLELALLLARADGLAVATAFRKIVDVGVEEPTRAAAKRKEPA